VKDIKQVQSFKMKSLGPKMIKNPSKSVKISQNAFFGFFDKIWSQTWAWAGR